MRFHKHYNTPASGSNVTLYNNTLTHCTSGLVSLVAAEQFDADGGG